MSINKETSHIDDDWDLHAKMITPLDAPKTEYAPSENSKDSEEEFSDDNSGWQQHFLKDEVESAGLAQGEVDQTKTVNNQLDQPLSDIAQVESDELKTINDTTKASEKVAAASDCSKLIQEEMLWFAVTHPTISKICENNEDGSAPLSGLSRIVIKVVNGQKQYFCNECPYHSNLKRSVNRHIEAVHMGLRSFKCPYCEYKANYMSNIKRHITSVHDGDRKFACPKCDYRTSDRGHLSSHIKVVHEKLKPFQCLECNYHASKRTDLNIHVKTVHNKEKPHMCPYCTYKASKNGNLKRHIKIVHEDPPPRKRKRRTNKYDPVQDSTNPNDLSNPSGEQDSLAPRTALQPKAKAVVATQHVLRKSPRVKSSKDIKDRTKEGTSADIVRKVTRGSSKTEDPQTVKDQGLEISLVSKVDFSKVDLVSQMMKNRDLEISLVPKSK